MIRKITITLTDENDTGLAPAIKVEGNYNAEALSLDIQTLIEKGVIGGKLSTGEVLRRCGIESDSHDTGTSTIPESDKPKTKKSGPTVEDA